MKHALPLSASLALLAAAACGNTIVAGTGSTSGGHTSTGSTSGSTSTTSTSMSSSTEGAGGASGTGGGGTGAGVPSDVTGTIVYRYFGEGAPVDVPAELVGAQIEAYVWGGSAWTTYPGTGTNQGTFTVPAVPAGLYMLNVAGEYVYTTAHKLDLGSEIAGRPSGVYGMASNSVAGVVTNMDAWVSNDTIEWFDANANGGAYSFEGATPSAGATSLNDEPSTWYGALIDGSQSDVLYATQLETQVIGAADVLTVTRFAAFMGVEQKDGTLASVTGAFADVPVTSVATIDFHASAFAKQSAAVHPGAMGEGAVYDLISIPGSGVAGDLGLTTDLVLVYPDETDVSLGAVKYANPFPLAWGTSVYAGESFSVSYPGLGSTAFTQYGSVSVIMPLAQASAGPIVPLVTPVQNALVGGKSALGSLTGIGLTPTLSWSPPAIGTPTAYSVTVYQIVGTGPEYVASIVTTTESLPLPPNVLQAGQPYIFIITALITPFDATTQPFHYGPTRASADLLTAVAVP